MDTVAEAALTKTNNENSTKHTIHTFFNVMIYHLPYYNSAINSLSSMVGIVANMNYLKSPVDD